MMHIKLDLVQWFTNFFDEKISGEIISNKELVAELHKPIIRKFEKRKVHSPLQKIFGALINKFNKGFKLLLWVIDIYSKYAWVIPLIHKK